MYPAQLKTIEELKAKNVEEDDLTLEKITEFLTGSYELTKHNPGFQRIHDLLFVTIPMTLSTGKSKLSLAIEGRTISWDDYAGEYTTSIEALVIFMFMEQIAQEGLGDSEVQPRVSIRDAASARGRRSGGRPKNRRGFCPLKHTKQKGPVTKRRTENSLWYGWYLKAIEIINERNAKYLEEHNEKSVRKLAGAIKAIEQEQDEITDIDESPDLAMDREALQNDLKEYNQRILKKKKRQKVSNEVIDYENVMDVGNGIGVVGGIELDVVDSDDDENDDEDNEDTEDEDNSVDD